MIQELVRQRELLRLEYEYEREQFQRQTEAMGVERKVRRGLCWFPVSVGRNYYNSLDQLVVEVTDTSPHDDIEHQLTYRSSSVATRPNEQAQWPSLLHQFEPGKPVCFFEQDASEMLRYMKFVGQVSYVEERRMVVVLPNADALTQIQNAQRLGVQLYLDEYTYRQMFAALDQVINAKEGRLAQLRDIIHASMPTGKFTFAPVRFPWLNPSQEQAVNEVLWAKDVAVVHGPPGTGKTTTLVEAIYETLRRENQVLVCAQSNMAVDWISEKLADRGVSVLRIGNPMRVTDRMLGFTYERRFESHPRYTDLWTLRREIRRLYDNRKGSTESFHQKIARLRDRCNELEYSINEDLFAEARVVACTLTGSANRLLVGHRFGTLFIDEAAQAMEAACWIAIQKAHRVILAGDHRQLPPTIKCPAALQGGLDKTLMQTLVERQPRCVSLLTVQYRMSDGIMQFPNREFYGGLLQSAPEVKYRGILDWDTAIDWTDTPDEVTYHEQQADDGQSRQNPAEAELTLQTLKQYIEKIGRDRVLYERLDVGIISPYRGQVSLLRRMLRHDAFWKPFRQLITINTIDGFQGQERDIIVISMVRSNENGDVGFLRDLRRMNVAITRARMKLLLIGHRPTLVRHPFYRRLIAYINELQP